MSRRSSTSETLCSRRDPVVATALLDRLLHHAIVVQIEGRTPIRGPYCAPLHSRIHRLAVKLRVSREGGRRFQVMMGADFAR